MEIETFQPTFSWVYLFTYQTILKWMLHWTFLPFAALAWVQSHSHFHTFRFLFLNIRDIGVLANYTNCYSYRWIDCEIVVPLTSKVTVLSPKGGPGVWISSFPSLQASPRVGFASCVPSDWLGFWCADTTSWSPSCVQWACSGSCENQHPFLCSRVTGCYNTISICKECALA